LRRIEAGEDFNKVASELTENPRAEETGPDRGFVARNAVPWLQDAVRSLQPGQHTGIVSSPAGYEILLMTDLRPALIADYGAVRDKVAKQWQAEQQQQARTRYLQALAEQFGVTILEKGLENANPAKQ
jgi:parvulin-like peptidyl-prolyl isomerase